MKSKIKIEQIYSEEHMIEVFIDITKSDISANISCYTQTSKLIELSLLCKKFIENSNPFEWFIGTKEYAYFKMNVELLDKLGHVKVAIYMLNNKDSSDIDYMSCEFFIILDLGQIKELGNKISKLNNGENNSIVITQE